jgi:hypothetical protein
MSEFKLFLITFFAEPDSGHTGNPLFSNSAISIGPPSTEVDIAQCNNPANDSGGKQLNGYFLQKSTVAIQAESTWPNTRGIAFLCHGAMEKGDQPSKVTTVDNGDGDCGDGRKASQRNHLLHARRLDLQ